MNFFINDFIVSFIITSIIIILILITKKVLRKYISINWNYRLYYLVFLLLSIPFIPINNNTIHYENTKNNTLNNIILKSTDTYNTINNFNNNFSISVNRFNFKIFFYIWIIGIFIFSIFIILNIFKLYRLKKSSFYDNETLKTIVNECKKTYNIKRNIEIGISDIKSPTIFGIFKTIIIIPKKCIYLMNEDELRYIILHELSHYKNKDIIINYIICLFQTIYWFNPIVWIVFKHMRNDREILCDTNVLKSINENEHTKYGMTLISFIEKIPKSNIISLSTDMGGKKKFIKKRIEHIAEFTNESIWTKIRGSIIFIFIICIIFSQSSKISFGYNNTIYNNQNKNIQEIDLQKYFENYDGTFVLYSMNDDMYSIYNYNNSIKRVSPNSTYKIYSGLSALENNIITPENSMLEWDGINRYYDEWNKNLDINTAMASSANWYFDKLNKMNGINSLKNDFKKIRYGNYNFNGGYNSYLESTLKISALEQVEILNNFYNNTYGFDYKNIETIKEAIKLYDYGDIVIYGKTGTGRVNENDINGWFIGFIEKNNNVYFYALNIQADNNATGIKAMDISLEILKDLKIY